MSGQSLCCVWSAAATEDLLNQLNKLRSDVEALQDAVSKVSAVWRAALALSVCTIVTMYL